jgi:hypothetical protein
MEADRLKVDRLSPDAKTKNGASREDEPRLRAKRQSAKITGQFT